jgi:hypothetical protein
MRVLREGKHWAIGHWECGDCNALVQVDQGDVIHCIESTLPYQMSMRCPSCGVYSSFSRRSP